MLKKFVITFFLIILVCILFAVFSHKVPQNIPAENRTQINSKQSLQWDKFSYDKEIKYSFEVPHSFSPCNGTDETGGLIGIRLTQIQGMPIDCVTNNNLKAEWLVVNGVFTQHHFLNKQAWGIPSGDFYRFFSSKKIGEKFGIQDEKNKEYIITRLNDIRIANTSFLIFQTDLTSVNFPSGIRQIAISRIKDQTIFLSFEHATSDLQYKDVFSHIVRTFTLF